MRVPAPVFLLLVLALLAAPGASAAGAFELVGGKILERPLEPGEAHEFRMPVLVHQDGALYAKVLPTPGNAVHDGARANGSVEDGTGWRVSFALEREDGTRVDLGERADSTLTPLVDVEQGERPTLVMTTHVPASATEGGPSQRVYVALAYRSAGAGATGSTSGAQMDESRAITLLHSNALLPPADGGEGGEPPADDAEIPPVGPIPEESTAGSPTVIVSSPGLPAWFLAGILVLGAAAVGLLGAIVALLARIERGIRQRRVPVAPAREPTQVPVATEAARDFLAALRKKP